MSARYDYPALNAYSTYPSKSGGHLQAVAALDEIDKWRAEIGQLRGLLWAMTDDDDCSLDHHGYCQTHGWFGEEECPNARARKYFDGAPG